jgi:hypothetical protein
MTVKTGGQASFDRGGTSTGTLVMEDGGLLVLAVGDHTMQAGASISGTGEIRVQGSARLIADDIALAGRVNLVGGQVGSNGDNGGFQLADGSAWTQGSLFGNLTIPENAALAVSGADGVRSLSQYASLTNRGVLRWEGPGSIQCYGDNRIVNEPGARIDLRADGWPFSIHFVGNILENRGIIEKSAGDGECEFHNVAIQNSGTFRAATGTMAFTSDISLADGSELQGPGGFILRSGQTSLNGTTTLAAGAALTLGGTELVGADAGATLAGGAVDWTAGKIRNTVTLTGTVATSGDTLKSLSQNAELKITNSLTLGDTGGLQFYGGSTLSIQPGAVLEIAGTTPLLNHFTGNTLRNEGTMRLGGAPTRIRLPWNFVQTGTGRLEIDIAGTGADPAEFDRLEIDGTAKLAGAVAPVPAAGYEPPYGTEFRFLTATGGLGGTRFDSVDGTGLSADADANATWLVSTAGGLDYDTWAADNHLTGADAARDADPDGDGFDNMAEYSFNLDPNKPDVLDTPSEIKEIEGQDWLVLHYRTWQNRIAAGMVYRAATSTDLETWQFTGIVDEPDPAAPAIEGSETRLARVPVTPVRKFLRIEASVSE